jgi:protein-S-isoprenylcysteine O-methyltransferase Ste14
VDVTFSERGGWWVVAQFAVFGLYAVAMLGTDGIDEGFGLGFARIVGAVMVAFAVVVGVWALFLLGRKLTMYPHPVHEAVLVAAGPYRLVRHPIYLAVITGGVGLGLVFLNTAGVAVALTFIPFFMAKSEFEEDRLVERVPGYRGYRSAIPYRLIPWLL